MICVWNPKAIDYTKGVEIYEPETERVFTEEEAKKQPSEVRRRLCVRGRKVGREVLTLEEAKDVLWNKNKKYV